MAQSALGRFFQNAFWFLYVDVERAARETKRLNKRFTDPKFVLVYQGNKCVSVDWSRGGISVRSTQKPALGGAIAATLESMTGRSVGQVTGKVVKHTQIGFAVDFDELNKDVLTAFDAAIREQTKS